MRCTGLGLGMAVLLSGGHAAAAVVPVSDVTGLLDAIANAQPGDEIVLADGTYAIGQNVNCNAAATSGEPIVVRAENELGAKIEFDAVEGFKVNAPYWHFIGLDVQGVCANDSNCEHAFHVVGAADGFLMRSCRVRDFNAQLKVNASDVGGTPTMPNDGVIELCDLGDTSGRQTGNPVTKLNIDGGERWIVRDNYIHDFHKDGGNGVSYGAFMKSGGRDGVFERNLVICDAGASNGGTRIGLSFGGGGTGNQFCAPAFDPNVPCDPEHTDGIMRNNIIVGCSDVGIYLNKSTGTSLLYNTLIATSGIDFRFGSTSGDATGNVVGGPIRDRDGAMHTEGVNLLDVSQTDFDGWYTDPLAGDLSLVGAAPTELVGMGTAEVTDDYCGRARPGADLTLGALEHSLGSCDTFPPPGGSTSGQGGGAGVGGSGAGGDSSGNGAGTGGPSGSAGTGAGGAAADPTEDGGCSCRTAGGVGGDGAALVWLLGLGLMARRRRAQ